MKITVCDVCYRKDKVQRESNWKLSYKSKFGSRIGLDACDEHKTWFKQFKTFDEANNAVINLYQ